MGLKTKNGLATASVKTFGGLARASVNTVQGLEVAHGPPAPPAFANYVDCWAALLADEIGANEASTYAVDEWTDLSGNNEHPAQATGSAQPTLDFNGVWEVVFGGDDYMSVNVTDHAAPHHMFVAFRTNDAAALQTVLDMNASGGGATLYVRASGQVAAYHNNYTDFGAIDTNPHYVSVLTKNTAVLRLDGAETTTSITASNHPFDQLFLGRYPAAALAFLNGAIRGFRLSPEQNNTNRDAMEAYMAGINTP